MIKWKIWDHRNSHFMLNITQIIIGWSLLLTVDSPALRVIVWLIEVIDGHSNPFLLFYIPISNFLVNLFTIDHSPFCEVSPALCSISKEFVLLSRLFSEVFSL